jgi:membrane-bound lytic murein transglycosylase D
MTRSSFVRLRVVWSVLLAVGCSAGVDHELEAPSKYKEPPAYRDVQFPPESDKSRVREEVFNEGPFAVPENLRERVDFWKDIFTKYGSAHSVIHHRDFPQIVFGVLDLSRERDAMSASSFDAYKTAVVKRTVENLEEQLLELSAGQSARTPFQERVLGELRRRRLPVSVLRDWVEQDLIRTQTGIRERYAEAVRRAWRYLPVMEQIFVSEYGLPKELTRIPFIESSFDYTAYSSVGAAGIWQFMPKTARAHRMVVGRHVDERRDPLKATRAAAEYLRSAYNSLGSWPLAITSYNHGVGGVRSKARKAGTYDLAAIIEDPSERYFGFASTNFYPEFLAAVEIFEDHQRYFPEVREEPPLRVVSYVMRGATSAPQLASRLGIPVEHLREANYGLLDSVWSGRASIPSGYTLRVPLEYRGRADQFFGSGTMEHVLKVGAERRDRPSRTDSDSSKEDEFPSLPVVPIESLEFEEAVRRPPQRVGGSAPARRVTPNSSVAKRKSVSTRSVAVRSGDTISSLAKRYGVGVERIKQLNNIRGSKLQAGQRILIPN